MNNDRQVTSCHDCPFSCFSLAGGHMNLIWTGRFRLQHSCNLQSTPKQFSKTGIYSCFATCPLKTSSFSVELGNTIKVSGTIPGDTKISGLDTIQQDEAQRLEKDQILYRAHTGAAGNTCACAACCRIRELLRDQSK